MTIPRSEYPRPQMTRDAWMNLNGKWQFEIDHGKSGRARRLFEAGKLATEILVPFCPESSLSGIGYTDFMASVWYTRTFELPQGWREGSRRTILHIDACDWRTEVWVNGVSAGTHIGGYVGFEFDITGKLHDGENRISVCAEDDVRSCNQPGGKQCHSYESRGCSYTRTTGIWQTVWLESVPQSYIKHTKLTPNAADCRLSVEAVCESADGKKLTAEAFFEGKRVGAGSGTVRGGSVRFDIALSELHLWEVGCGRLYDLTLTLEGGDVAGSYFGMRDLSWQDGRLYINGEFVYQRLILDQGFYPDGIYTAPDDGELEADIDRSLLMGFNGARLHQKIFEPRFLYHCDRKGYIVWGEHASWGLDIGRPEAWEGFVPEWLEALCRDYNHPAIIGWCPLNETNRAQNKSFLRYLAAQTRAFDPTRPYIDTSGYVHIDGYTLTDFVDEHYYEQDPAKFAEHYAPLLRGEPIEVNHDDKQSGCVTFVSEYGGILWNIAGRSGWGYGQGPQTGEEFIERYRALTAVLLNHPKISGFCYTQLTDVEQELNGLYTYNRKPKFPPAIISAATKGEPTPV